MQTSKSAQSFSRAQRKIPGGVNSPVRAWKAVGGIPRFIARGRGAYLFDIDKKKYIDFVGSWGPLILGHAHPKVVAAINRSAQSGTSFGAPTEREVELAECVARRMPSIERLRLVSSGTEAAMSAIRLARAFTGRTKIVKFAGCYHGHSDGLLAKAGSGVATLALPDSAGVPQSFTKETIVLPYNNVAAVERLFDRAGRQIAGVIVEPICGNMGVIAPEGGFLPALRAITDQSGALLIFDEVITGFRVASGGAQELFKIRPDLTCLGKILGGGLPLAAFGGRSDVMMLLAPEGPVYQAGTLSGNPLAVSAGLVTLGILARGKPYAILEKFGKKLAEGLREVFQRHGLRTTINRVGSMLTIFFGVDRVHDAAEAAACDRQLFASFFHGMLARGIYFPPSALEAAFISLAHTDSDLDRAVNAVEDWAKQK
ncbi:MAG TPA: glutamate-1-semialdehyde 2,1-aminomutase [Candidatus Binatia bacterium]|jgi:glutamate-1-semialdehyde 2,1-aminomutase